MPTLRHHAAHSIPTSTPHNRGGTHWCFALANQLWNAHVLPPWSPQHCNFAHVEPRWDPREFTLAAQVGHATLCRSGAPIFVNLTPAEPRWDLGVFYMGRHFGHAHALSQRGAHIIAFGHRRAEVGPTFFLITFIYKTQMKVHKQWRVGKPKYKAEDGVAPLHRLCAIFYAAERHHVKVNGSAQAVKGRQATIRS